MLWMILLGLAGPAMAWGIYEAFDDDDKDHDDDTEDSSDEMTDDDTSEDMSL